jgi:hypothetical protein
LFERTKERWREARGPAALKEAQYIIDRYQMADGYNRYVVTSAFEYTLDDLEIAHGAIDSWLYGSKIQRVQELKEAATQGNRSNIYGAGGVGLLALFIEAQTLPNNAGAATYALIAEWRHKAVAADIKSRSV